MKRSIALTGVLLLAIQFQVQAFEPPPPKTFAERVDLASHIIVGTAKKVTVVQAIEEAKNEWEFQEVKPEPNIIDGRGQFIEVEIEIDEVLYPTRWKASKVRYLFGGGFFSVGDVHKDVLNRKLIYLMSLDPYGVGGTKEADNIFFPSYDWHLCDSLERKAEVQGLIDARLKREQEQQKPK